MESTSTHPELERLLTHQDWLRSLARRLVGDAAAAEDLVQETWIAALKSPPDPDRPAKPWLAGVVRRLASMRARGEGRRARRQTAVAKPDVLPSTAELVEEVDTQRRLVSEVLELSEPYRTTVMLRYFQNMSSAEISRHQGVPPGTVRWRLKRGLDELRGRLDESFGSRDDWCIALLPLAKLGLGTGGASVATGGTVAGAMAVLAKVAAGILAIWGLFEIPSLMSNKADLVWAGDPSAELVSLQPEGLPEGDASEAAQLGDEVERNSVAPNHRRVRILDANQEPLVGVRVALNDGRDISPLASTDEEGQVEFLTTMIRADLYIQQENSFLQRLPVEFTAMGIDVVLARGAQLTGRVLAGEGEQVGSVAMADLSVRLDSDQVLWGGGILPKGIAARFENASWITATTDGLGAFHFENLPQDWSGKLWLPAGVVMPGADRREAEGRYMYFDAPVSDSMVSVRRLPRLKGRVLDPGGKPALGARILCWVDGAQTPISGLSDEQGNFDVQLDSDGQSGLRIELVSEQDQFRRTLAFAGDQIPSRFNLGEVRLAQTTLTSFRVTTSEGLGIAGARVVHDGALLPGDPSGEDGQGSIQLPSEAGEFTVQAFGFRPGKLGAGNGSEGMHAELAPAAIVTWHVTDEIGHSLDGVTLRVRSGLRLFADGEPYTPSNLDAGRKLGSFVGVGSHKDEPFGEFRTNETGRLQLCNLTPGALVWIDVLDQVGHVIHSARLSALGEGERRNETMIVPGRLHSFHGLVHDRGDNVLVGVELELSDHEGRKVQAMSGLDGQVLLEDLAGDRYDLTVRKRGYVAQTISNLSFSAGSGSAVDKPYEIVLERAADLAVLVVSGANVPVFGGRIVARRTLDGKEYEAAPLGAADQTLEDMDQGEVELTLYLGGVQYTEVAQPHLDDSVEFRVPAHGSAQVTWSLPDTLDATAELTLVAVALDLEGKVLQDRVPVRLPIGKRTGSQGVTHFQALLPGAYSIVLEGPGEAGKAPLTAPVPIQVALGTPARAEVRL